MRAIHGILDRARLGRQAHQVIERHQDVRSPAQLQRNRLLRRQLQRAAVDVRSEGDAILPHADIAAEAEDLEAAAIGQDRTGPNP